MFNRDDYMGTYNATEIYELYNIEQRIVYSCVFDKKDYNGYYFELEEDLSDLWNEWNNVREMILNSPDRFVKVIIHKPFWKNEKPRVEKVPINIDK